MSAHLLILAKCLQLLACSDSGVLEAFSFSRCVQNVEFKIALDLLERSPTDSREDT